MLTEPSTTKKEMQAFVEDFVDLCKIAQVCLHRGEK